MTKKTFDRRNLVKFSAAGTGLVLFGANRVGAQTSSDDAPHFFINLIFPGGLDPVYFFDSRPQALTKEKLLVNYSPEEAVLLKGTNGGETFRSMITEPLMPFQKDFTIVNGVHMVAAFDGHPQNMNYLFTGNAFGGESFIPHLNRGQNRLAIDLIESGSAGAETTNSDASIPMTAKSAADLANKLSAIPNVGGDSPLDRHLTSRFNHLAQGNGGFNNAAKKFLSAHQQIPNLMGKIRDFSISEFDPAAQEEPLIATLALIREVFKSGVSKSATWVFGRTDNPPNLDTHDAQTAAAMPEVAKNIVADLALVFKFLKETAYDDSRSLFDVTTLMVSSEFARSMRQTYLEFEKSGNDHNPLNNSIIIAGKGITGGQVIGQSDFRSVEEVKAGAQGAHLKLDSQSTKVMGRPFNFDTGECRESHAEVYKIDNYLSINSVINSIYKIFDVNESLYRVNERNGPAAKILSGLIATE